MPFQRLWIVLTEEQQQTKLFFIGCKIFGRAENTYLEMKFGIKNSLLDLVSLLILSWRNSIHIYNLIHSAVYEYSLNSVVASTFH